MAAKKKGKAKTKNAAPVAIVTGSSRGIGKETARSLRDSGYCVILACRSSKKAAEVLEEFGDAPSGCCGSAEFMELDLSTLSSVRAFCKSFLDTGRSLQVLICNAGMNSESSSGKPTVDGFDDVFATNYIGHYLLCHLLVDALVDTSGCILMVSSVMHRSVTNAAEALCDDGVRGHHGDLYSLSKLAQILHAQEIARRFPEITSICVNPGGVGSEIWRDWPWWKRAFIKLLTTSPSVAGRAIAAAASSGEYDPGFPAHYLSSKGKLPASIGEYLDPTAGDRYTKLEPAPISMDDELAQRLWSDSARWVGIEDSSKRRKV